MKKYIPHIVISIAVLGLAGYVIWRKRNQPQITQLPNDNSTSRPEKSPEQINAEKNCRLFMEAQKNWNWTAQGKKYYLTRCARHYIQTGGKNFPTALKSEAIIVDAHGNPVKWQ